MSSDINAAQTELERKLVEQIRREGPITFRDFMRVALYDSDLGYYNTERPKIGAAGDYYTSSNVHQAFGAVLARAFVELWANASKPLKIVEFGAGTGQLARDVVSAIRDEHPPTFERLTYLIVETSPAMIRRQREQLADFGGRIRWCDLESLDRSPVGAIAFSNEFVDAMPVHRVCFRNGSLEELYVTATPGTETSGKDETHLTIVWGPLSCPQLSDYVDRLNVSLSEGQIIEINLDAIDWLGRVSRAIERGYLVTIDYGDLAQHLWSEDRKRGTLRSFYKHRLIDSPLERIGEQDITASVNFTSLIEYGRDFGFEAVSFERQSYFLIRMGLIERIAAAHTASNPESEARGHFSSGLKERLAAKNLFVPGGVSDNFRVLIQRKGKAQ